MKHRLLALALAACAVLSLTACGGDAGDVQPVPDPSESVIVTPEGTVEPSATTIPDKGTPPPEYTHHPDEHHSDAVPTPTHHPDEHHSDAVPTPTPAAIGDPTAPPSEAPAKALSADAVYAAWTSSGAGSGFIDMSAHLDAFYDLDGGELESFVFYQPDMSSSLQEVFLAKAKPGKASSVKAACQSRLEGLREQAQFYPGTSEYVDGAKLEAVGDWVVLAACSDAGRLVQLVKDTAK